MLKASTIPDCKIFYKAIIIIIIIIIIINSMYCH
jgi:hypothetical protein